VDRRGFLGVLSAGLGAVVAGAAAICGLVYVVAPALRRGQAAADGAGWSKVKVAEGAGFEPVRVTVDVASDAGWATTMSSGAVYLDRDANGQYVCFSARCPHEGCQVGWKKDAGQYVCPCHNSTFGRDGSRVSGPTRRGLDPLDVRPAGSDSVEVRYAMFALDSADRVRVG
jgi:menaquinol-cytochrome c reductase iron-sulfur subunit